MKEEKDFDKIIRSKFAEKEFIFNEANWERVEQKLDANRTRALVIRRSLIFIIGLSIGILLMFPFIFSSEEESNNGIPRVNVSTQSVPSLKQKIRIESENNSSLIGRKIKESDTFPVGAENKSKTEKQSEINPAHLVAIDASSSALTHTSPISNKSSHQNITEASKGIASLRAATPSTSQELTESLRSSENNNFITQATKEEKKDLPSESNDIISPIDSSSALAKNSNYSSTLQQDTSSTPLIDSSVASDQTRAEKTKIDSSHTSKADTILINPIDSNKQPPADQEKNNNTLTHFSLEFGADYTLGWNYGDISEANGLNPVFGISIHHHLNSNWSFLTGIHYGSITRLKACQKAFSYKTFDFGSTIIDTIVDTKRIYYIRVPLQLAYNINNNNSIGIGGLFSYLLNTASHVSINTNNTGPIIKKELGYYAGAFKKWDAALALSYRRKISDKIGLAALSHIGLIDIKSDNFFSKQKFERNVGLIITLTYDL